MSKKKVVVNKKFLLDLADDIYDPKSKGFLRLCSGTLQNGPDPDSKKKRTMHCGLGELYFAMTGRQPEQDGVSEEDVTNKAVELSTLPKVSDVVNEAKLAIKKLKLGSVAEETLLDALYKLEDDGELLDEEVDFREALDFIPQVNDAGDDDHENSVKNLVGCKVGDLRNRSKQVAAQLRKAAALLPEVISNILEEMIMDMNIDRHSQSKNRQQQRREEALARKAESDKLTPQQRLEALDKVFGKDQGAARERRRLRLNTQLSQKP